MDCFDKKIHLLDQNSSEFSIKNKEYQSKILKMLKTCFPYSEIHSHDYFNTPHQRIICLFLTNGKNQMEIVGVCFIRQVLNDACFIHSVCVRKSSQGHKCCDRIFSYLVSNYGEYNLFLFVKIDTYAGQDLPENKAAIRCYSKYGFVFMDNMCTNGSNCKMIRMKN